MQGLTINTEEKGGIVLISCEGYIDSMTSPEIENVIGKYVSKKKYKIVIDLKGVDYVSSAGWGIFVAYVKAARTNKGDIKFAGMKQEVLEVFELLDFTNILDYHKLTDDAIRAF